jgi:cyanophycin synthetase
MELLDARRLTGKNLIWDHPGAIADVRLEAGEPAQRVIDAWQPIAREMLDAVGWEHEQATARPLCGGVSLAISAPIDALYAAVELIEWTVARAFDVLDSPPTGASDTESPAAASARLRDEIEQEGNPALIALKDDAEAHGVAFLSDDDEVSVGLGRGSRTWPVDALPASVDWHDVHDVPVGIVTGTNGKTTTVRLLTQMVRAGGLNAGMSSTDWIGVNDEVIDRGDYSGPGGARAVLRRREVDVAILETARGGLLRRGLGVEHADASLITNIAEDHLGDFGSHSVAELLNVKWVVMRALGDRGRAVLNADDALLVAKSAELDRPITWFTRHAPSEALRRHIAAGGHAVYVEQRRFCHVADGVEHPVLDVADAPITLNGAAGHNVANAAAAIAMGFALGLPTDAIAGGLRRFTADQNPGRCNLFQVDGVDVLLDFAHNPDGMAAVFDVAESRHAKRRALCFAQAGDRPDDSIRELARAAWQIGLDRVVISELPHYRRGREPNEVYRLLRDALIDEGATAAMIGHHETELESLRDALAWAQPGDLVIMLGLGEQQALLEELHRRADR